MRHVLRGAALAVGLLVAGCAGPGVAPAPAAEELVARDGFRLPGDPAYLALLAQAKRDGAGITTARMQALRAAWVRSPDYDPVLPSRLAQRVQPRAGNDCARADPAADAVLAIHWLDLRAHAVKLACARRAGDRAAETLHEAVRDAIVAAIRASGDGATSDRAMTVIAVDEEYALLEVMGLRRTTQMLVERGGRRFDMMGVEGQGRDGELWFNVDAPFAAYERRTPRPASPPPASPTPASPSPALPRR